MHTKNKLSMKTEMGSPKIMITVSSSSLVSSPKHSPKTMKQSQISKFGGAKNFSKLALPHELVQQYLNEEYHPKGHTRSITERLLKPLNRLQTQSAYLTGFDVSQHQKYSQTPAVNSQFKQSQIAVTERMRLKKRKLKSNMVERKISSQSILEIYSEYVDNCRIIEDLKSDEETDHLQILKFEDIKKKVLQTQPNLQLSLMSQQLHQNSRNDVTLDMFRFYYYSFKIKQRSSPLSIFFSQLSQNMKIYVSRFAMYPNRFNAEFQVQSKIFKLHTTDPIPIFQEESIYITIYSDKDTSLSLDISFGKQIKSTAVRHQKITHQYLYSEQYEEQPAKPSDIIKKNCDVTTFSQAVKSQLSLIKSGEKHSRMMEISQKKKTLDEDKKFDVLSKLLAVGQLKNVRRYQQYQTKTYNNQQNLSLNWLQLIHLTDFIRHIKQYLKVVKKRRMSIATGRLYAMKRYANMMYKLKKTGETQTQRILFNIKMYPNKVTARSCRMFATTMHKKSNQRVRLIVLSFLEEAALYTLMLTKHTKSIKLIIQIQQKFRNLKKQRKNHRETIQRVFQQNIVDNLRQFKETQLGIIHSVSDKHKSADQHRKLFGSEFVLDIQLMNTIIDQFVAEKKGSWMEFLRRTLFQPDNKQKTFDRAIYLKQPKQYEIPNNEEISQLIKMYGITKKLI